MFAYLYDRLLIKNESQISLAKYIGMPSRSSQWKRASTRRAIHVHRYIDLPTGKVFDIQKELFSFSIFFFYVNKYSILTNIPLTKNYILIYCKESSLKPCPIRSIKLGYTDIELIKNALTVKLLFECKFIQLVIFYPLKKNCDMLYRQVP